MTVMINTAVNKYNDDSVFSNTKSLPHQKQCVGRENSDVNRAQGLSLQNKVPHTHTHTFTDM